MSLGCDHQGGAYIPKACSGSPSFIIIDISKCKMTAFLIGTLVRPLVFFIQPATHKTEYSSELLPCWKRRLSDLIKIDLFKQ